MTGVELKRHHTMPETRRSNSCVEAISGHQWPSVVAKVGRRTAHDCECTCTNLHVCMCITVSSQISAECGSQLVAYPSAASICAIQQVRLPVLWFPWRLLVHLLTGTRHCVVPALCAGTSQLASCRVGNCAPAHRMNCEMYRQYLGSCACREPHSHEKPPCNTPVLFRSIAHRLVSTKLGNSAPGTPCPERGGVHVPKSEL